MIRFGIGVVAALLFGIGLLPAAVAAEDFTYCKKGDEQRQAGDPDAAITSYSRCIRDGHLAAVNLGDAYHRRGRAYEDKGDYERAIGDQEQALHYNPKDGYAYDFRGRGYMSKHQYAPAISDFEKAIELEPGYEDSYNNLAWILATARDARLRDGARAVTLAEKAVAMLPQEPTHLDTLAAAYAEAGRFADAVATQQKAIAALPASRRGKHLQEFQDHLATYQQSKPLRD